MRSIEELTDDEAHKLYCVAMGIRDDLNQNLKYKRTPNSIRIEKKDKPNVLFHLHYYRPGISGTVFELSMRARNYEGEASTIQVISAIRYLESIGVSLTALSSKVRHA